MLTMQIGIVLSGLLFSLGAVQLFRDQRRLKRQLPLLAVVQEAGEREREARAQEERQRQEEEERQAGRTFFLDFMVCHGAAFGGFSATCPDGRRRKGLVPLDQILLYGRQPSGKEYTYYIEDQGIVICAADEPDALYIKAEREPFEIREAGLSRDQGVTSDFARISKDILYYIILESHHEISVRACGQGSGRSWA